MSEIYALARTAQGKLLREVELKDHDLRRLCGHANLYDALLRDLTRAKQIQDERNHQNKMRNIHNHTPYHHHSHHSTYNAPRPQLASITQSAISVAAQELDLELAHMEHATLEYSYENSQVSVNGEFVDVDMGEDSESDYGDEMDEEMDMECDWDELDGEFELCRESELVEAVAVAMDRFGIEKQDVHKEPEWRFQRPDGREISTYRWKSPVAAGMTVSAS